MLILNEFEGFGDANTHGNYGREEKTGYHGDAKMWWTESGGGIRPSAMDDRD
jgi:hypothetical protein